MARAACPSPRQAVGVGQAPLAYVRYRSSRVEELPGVALRTRLVPTVDLHTTGVGAWGFGIRDQGLRTKVQVLGFRVQGSGFSVQSLG